MAVAVVFVAVVVDAVVVVAVFAVVVDAVVVVAVLAVVVIVVVLKKTQRRQESETSRSKSFGKDFKNKFFESLWKEDFDDLKRNKIELSRTKVVKFLLSCFLSNT